ncbi:MAG: ABC transporter ATP-binding protein [Firmicutes bacterium]|nr:ABC transporter ATP-binding protein [Bacillota bacterium]
MKDFKEISLRNLNKSFGTTQVLHDFNLTLKKGEFVTLLGPSGCGKSTVLNCIAGLTPITSGKIYIDEECIDDGIHTVPAEKRGFGMVFQNYALFPHLNVFNNIAFGLQLKKLPRPVIAEKVANALRMVHLEGYENKFPSQMSGGEQQRVAIARCIVMEPRLLMLDEPLSNLDAKLRIDMRYELKSLHEKLQITSIYVTHDQQEALALSDRIVVMKNGRIQQVGTPEEVYFRPANLFVADFMGFRNIWPGVIEEILPGGEVIVEVKGLKLKAAGSLVGRERREAPHGAMGVGAPVFTAIRPEDVQLGEGPANRLACRIEVVEYLGQLNQAAALMENGVRLDLRTDERIKAGERCGAWIPPERILLFPGRRDEAHEPA